MGVLYIVGTPIGNLEDITGRAARILGQASLVAAEDTRVTRRLLNHLASRVPVISCHAHNWQARLPELLQALQTGDVALVADAGMPAISDPGAAIADRVAAAGFPVEAIPGPSAVTTALAVAGLPADRFLFLGFLPRQRRARRKLLTGVAALPFTLVIFEAPHRLRATLEDLPAALGDRRAAVCRELTKRHEAVWRGSLAQALTHFEAPRGEFTLVVAGADPVSNQPPTPDREAARAQMADLRQAGARAREAVTVVSQATGLPRQEAYRLWLEAGGKVAAPDDRD